MSRYSSAGSYGHHCKRRFSNEYILSWAVDWYYRHDRLRYPRYFHRDTDEAGARRFCKRWKIKFPEPPPDNPTTPQ